MSNQKRIGIFEGKKAEYNMAILEILFKQGPLTNWEIAKQIFSMLKGRSNNPDIAYYPTQKIYGVIERKEGRLEELNQKEYIMLKNGKWELCFPKGLAILIRKPEIISEVHEYYLRKPTVDEPRFPKLKNFKAPFGLRFQVDTRQVQAFVKACLAKFNNRLFFSGMAKSMEKLVSEGIDLDKIDNANLVFLVVQNMRDFMSRLTNERVSSFCGCQP